VAKSHLQDVVQSKGSSAGQVGDVRNPIARFIRRNPLFRKPSDASDAPSVAQSPPTHTPLSSGAPNPLQASPEQDRAPEASEPSRSALSEVLAASASASNFDTSTRQGASSSPPRLQLASLPPPVPSPLDVLTALDLSYTQTNVLAPSRASGADTHRSTCLSTLGESDGYRTPKTSSLLRQFLPWSGLGGDRTSVKNGNVRDERCLPVKAAGEGDGQTVTKGRVPVAVSQPADDPANQIRNISLAEWPMTSFGGEGRAEGERRGASDVDLRRGACHASMSDLSRFSANDDSGCATTCAS
jgi:hypothetical protein